MRFIQSYIISILIFLVSCNRPTPEGKSSGASHFKNNTAISNSSKILYINSVTGESIQPIINSLGDTIKTRVLIPVLNKIFDPFLQQKKLEKELAWACL
jgi:hypothetical protein